MESLEDAGKNNFGRAATTCRAVATGTERDITVLETANNAADMPGATRTTAAHAWGESLYSLVLIINYHQSTRDNYILFSLMLIHCSLSLSPWYVAFALVTVRNDSGTFWMYRRCHPITVVPRSINQGYTERDWATSLDHVCHTVIHTLMHALIHTYVHWYFQPLAFLYFTCVLDFQKINHEQITQRQTRTIIS